MRNIIKITALLLVFATLASLVSCAELTELKPQRRIMYYFDTLGEFFDYTGGSDSEFELSADIAEEELALCNKLFDIYNEYTDEGITNIATLNRLAGEGPQKVDKRIIDMLSFSKEIYTLTDGYFNVAMGAVLKIWHDYREEGVELPPMQLLEAAAEHTDINDLVIDRENMTVELRDPEMSLDVGAIGKGYAVELAAKALKASGCRNGYLINMGGNIRAVGEKSKGVPFSSGVSNPDKSSSEKIVYYFDISDSAAVTSGSYIRKYTVDGKDYHHIISKDTLMPENHYLSVSVLASSSAFADALSTALFSMEFDTAAAIIESLSNVTVVFVMPDGEVRVVESSK